MALRSTDEKDLLIQVSKGNEQAFAFLFNKYFQKIYTFALPLLKNEQLAEELAQEVMLKLWRMGIELANIENLDAFLRTTSRNRAIDVLRRQQSLMRLNQIAASQTENYTNETEEYILLQDARRLLQEAVDSLPAQQQQVYLLTEREGADSTTIAAQLGLSKSTVQSHLKLARRKLRNYLSQHVDLTALLIIFKLF